MLYPSETYLASSPPDFLFTDAAHDVFAVFEAVQVNAGGILAGKA